jgi:uncharacterized OB-fold protein
MSDEHFALPEGLPIPAPETDGLSAPYWEGLARGCLLVQRCRSCGCWQWGPEWICHACLSLEMAWEEVEPRGRIHVAQRIWHPVHPALKGATPYLAVLVELPQAGGIRMLGNLLGDPMRNIATGTEVQGVFEHHRNGAHPYSLLNWRLA